MDEIPNDLVTKRRLWVEHRFEAYVGARYLTNKAFYTAAFMLASYAIEFSLKQLVCEHFNFDEEKIQKIKISGGKSLIQSHNLEAIYIKLLDEKIVDGILSVKFLRELTTQAHRYPTQKIKAWNRARARGEPQVPLIMYYLDSVFTKLDYFILAKYGFRPESNSSAFICALAGSDHNNYFVFNIHARDCFIRYIKVLGSNKVSYKNGKTLLKDVDRDKLFWSYSSDINKDFEPLIPDPSDNIAKYDDLSFR